MAKKKTAKATLQNVVKSFPTTMWVIISTKRDKFHINADGFGIKCQACLYGCDGQSTFTFDDMVHLLVGIKQEHL